MTDFEKIFEEMDAMGIKPMTAEEYAETYADKLDKAAAAADRIEDFGGDAIFPKICIYRSEADGEDNIIIDISAAIYDKDTDTLALTERGTGYVLQIYNFADALDHAQEQMTAADFRAVQIDGNTADNGLVNIKSAFSLYDY